MLPLHQPGHKVHLEVYPIVRPMRDVSCSVTWAIEFGGVVNVEQPAPFHVSQRFRTYLGGPTATQHHEIGGTHIIILESGVS